MKRDILSTVGRVNFSEQFDIGDADFLDLEGCAMSPVSRHIVMVSGGTIYVLNPDLSLYKQYIRQGVTIYRDPQFLDDKTFVCLARNTNEVEQWHIDNGFVKSLCSTEFGWLGLEEDPYHRHYFPLNNQKVLFVDVAVYIGKNSEFRSRAFIYDHNHGDILGFEQFNNTYHFVTLLRSCNRLVLVNNKHRKIDIHDSETNTLLQSLEFDVGSYADKPYQINVSLSPDQQYLICTASPLASDAPAVVNVFEFTSGKLISKVELVNTHGIADAHLTREKRYLIAVENKKTLKSTGESTVSSLLLIDLYQSKIIASVALGEYPSAIFVDPATKHITVVGDEGAYIINYNPPVPTLESLCFNANPRLFSFAPTNNDPNITTHVNKAVMSKP
jgi:hypothetical protein